MHALLVNTFRDKWSFERLIYHIDSKEIIQKSAGAASYVFDAALTFIPYREHGIDHTGQAFFRHYRYALTPQGLDVFYDDGPQIGRLYQSYEPSPCGKLLLSVGAHLCGEDLYEGRYIFETANRFALTTIVTGRNKNFKIVTQYRR